MFHFRSFVSRIMAQNEVQIPRSQLYSLLNSYSHLIVVNISVSIWLFFVRHHLRLFTTEMSLRALWRVNWFWVVSTQDWCKCQVHHENKQKHIMSMQCIITQAGILGRFSVIGEFSWKFGRKTEVRKISVKLGRKYLIEPSFHRKKLCLLVFARYYTSSTGQSGSQPRRII